MHSNTNKLNKNFNTLQSSSIVRKFSHSYHILKGDSGATNHYISPDAIHLLTNLQNNTNIHGQLPDSTTLSSTHTRILNIPRLSTAAKTAHLLPGLQNTSLMSLGQLVDDSCVILLTKNHLNVFRNFESIIQGVRNTQDRLWDIPFPTKHPSPTFNSTNTKQQNQTLNIITQKINR